MNSIIDVTLFNAHHSLQSSPQSPPKKSSDGVFLCDTVMILSNPLTDNSMNILCEILKIIFNQTVHWSDEVKHTKVCTHVQIVRYNTIIMYRYNTISRRM